MSSATLTSKGQITIPAEVRRRLSLEEGDKVIFVELEGGGYKLAPVNVPMKAIKGLVPRPAKPVTVAEMNAAVRRQAAARSRRKP